MTSRAACSKQWDGASRSRRVGRWKIQGTMPEVSENNSPNNRKANFTWSPYWCAKRASTQVPWRTFDILPIGREIPIWSDTEYVVAAVIKIHFRPGTLKKGDRQTRIIRDLARSLAELLSLWFREKLYRASKDFARQRLLSCEILAHELRNTLVKLGFVFSAINAQIAILRENWEDLLRRQVPGLEWKGDVLGVLCGVLSEKSPELTASGELFGLYQGLVLNKKNWQAFLFHPSRSSSGSSTRFSRMGKTAGDRPSKSKGNQLNTGSAFKGTAHRHGLRLFRCQ